MIGPTWTSAVGNLNGRGYQTHLPDHHELADLSGWQATTVMGVDYVGLTYRSSPVVSAALTIQTLRGLCRFTYWSVTCFLSAGQIAESFQ